MWKWEAEGQVKAVAVIVHSAYEHHRWYAWLIEKLRSEGFHVVMGDLPGHGEKAKYHRAHDETFEDYIEYIKTMVSSALTYQLPLFIIGHGLGATLTVKLLQEEKIECAGIVLTAPWFQLRLQAKVLASVLTTITAVTAKMKINHPFEHKLLSKDNRSFLEMNDDIPYTTLVTVRWYRDLQLFMKQVNNPKSKKLSVPILMMTAKNDQVADSPSARTWFLQQQPKEMQFKEWPNSYHNLFHDAEREEVFMYTRDFMHNVVRSIGYVVD